MGSGLRAAAGAGRWRPAAHLVQRLPLHSSSSSQSRTSLSSTAGGAQPARPRKQSQRLFHNLQGFLASRGEQTCASTCDITSLPFPCIWASLAAAAPGGVARRADVLQAAAACAAKHKDTQRVGQLALEPVVQNGLGFFGAARAAPLKSPT